MLLAKGIAWSSLHQTPRSSRYSFTCPMLAVAPSDEQMGEILSGLPMAAMIAGMSGVGTGKGRARPWGLLRSGAVALLAALGVVLVAARVNPARVPVERVREAVLEETLAEVELDTRTLRTVVDSLAKRTRARFVIYPGLLQAIEADDLAAGRSPEGTPVLQRFRDVRLG